MEKAYSVSKLTTYIKSIFDHDPIFSHIKVVGEISNCKYQSSGHIYFTLKDEKAQISTVMFAGRRANGLRIQLVDGMKVEVSGSIEVYAQGGKYQLYASNIEELGKGDLAQKFEELKLSLEKKGLFNKEYKKALPRFASRIGIVTSPTGAAIEDIINVSKSRNPYVELILYPALVQGENAHKSIIKALKVLDSMSLDIIIIGRGGGSIEDLWAFNEEDLAFAIFEANTPIISAVGHETDFTIADFVADLRAATPSQAAEIANFVYKDYINTLDNISIRMKNEIKHRMNFIYNRLKDYKIKINIFSPNKKINQYKTYLNDLSNILAKKFDFKLNNTKSKLAIYSTKLDNLSPLKRISSGYAYISDLDENRISKASMLKKNDKIRLTFVDGRLSAKVIDIENK